ncbi:hypothetical protein FKP32DRAFT_1587472 [Trametes sanguinea]|nr:hypothetical protein FKP32DRAFT_1587472 [Trametes sanguinea]
MPFKPPALSASPDDHQDDSTPLLVPLEALQYNLHRQLYPSHFLHDTLDPPFAAFMSQPPLSPKTATASPPAPSSDAADPPQPPSNTTQASSSDDGTPAHACQWTGCDKVLSDPETLYNHLCNDHIGRKSTGNLCLTCKWKDCGTTCAKRDHITSHLRVHTPLKPHVCEICKKPFKRPQDLKKHEKIHTEEHHAQHKHSKAITVTDPAYSQRVRGDSDKPRPVVPSSGQSQGSAAARAKSTSLPLSDSSSGADFGVLPTPSPELDYGQDAAAAHSRNQLYRAQPPLPTWEVLPEDVQGRGIPVSGSKRSYDYNVDDFFTDVKKRRVTPAYDPLDMAARLSNLAYQQSLSATTHGGPGPAQSQQHLFPPRSVSFDIRTPEELAAVNEFLITLGRDVSQGNSHAARQQHAQAQAQAMNHHNPVDDASFFDPANLAQLGLAGMPGVPTAPGPGSGAGYHGDSGFAPLNEFSSQQMSGYPSRSSHQSVQAVQFGIYPSAQDIAGPAAPLPYTSNRQRAHRTSATEDHFAQLNNPSPPFPPHQYSSGQGGYPHYLTPPLDLGPSANAGASPLSSHSGMSTPPSATPPHMPLSMDHHETAAFDFMRSNRAPPPVVQLAPADYSQKNMRTVLPLKSAGPAGPSTSTASAAALAGRPAPVEPKIGAGGVHRGPPARLTASSAASSVASSSIAPSQSSPLYPLLTSGDERLKLPPLGARFRSPSPSPSPPSMGRTLSRSSTASPAPSPYRRSPSPISTDSRTPSPPRSSAPTPLPPSSSSARVSYPVLPPISALASYPSPRREHTEDLARRVGKIELESHARTRAVSPEERRKHAALLRDLLVAINTEYKRRYGTPPPVSREASGSQMDVETEERKGTEVRGLEKEMRDVEMVAA